MLTDINLVRILGIEFYNDSLKRALKIAHQEGGLFWLLLGQGSLS